MNRREFTDLMERHFGDIAEINATKGKDYASEADALDNFKRHAATLGLSPVQVWAVYTSKHWDAVMTFCREGAVHSEPIEGRIHDVILYCFLLLALIEEGSAG
jgi:hypothetical protein